MKTRTLLIAAGMLLATSCGYSRQKSAAAPKERTMTNNVSVIELFTSEGCSSCPSADALMPKLQEQYGDKLIILAFHVDYWDRLGWKDAFSKPEWTRRQNQYASALGADNIYTPQAVVNGSGHITGSNKSGVQDLIGKGLSSSQPIELTAKKDGANGVSVSYKTSLKSGEVVNLALVQRHATTNVRRGENGGRKLEHYNVVRDFSSSNQGNDSKTFSLPDGLNAADVHIIAYVQQSGNMHISAARETGIE